MNKKYLSLLFFAGTIAYAQPPKEVPPLSQQKIGELKGIKDMLNLMPDTIAQDKLYEINQKVSNILLPYPKLYEMWLKEIWRKESPLSPENLLTAFSKLWAFIGEDAEEESQEYVLTDQEKMVVLFEDFLTSVYNAFAVGEPDNENPDQKYKSLPPGTTFQKESKGWLNGNLCNLKELLYTGYLAEQAPFKQIWNLYPFVKVASPADQYEKTCLVRSLYPNRELTDKEVTTLAEIGKRIKQIGRIPLEEEISHVLKHPQDAYKNNIKLVPFDEHHHIDIAPNTLNNVEYIMRALLLIRGVVKDYADFGIRQNAEIAKRARTKLAAQKLIDGQKKPDPMAEPSDPVAGGAANKPLNHNDKDL